MNRAELFSLWLGLAPLVAAWLLTYLAHSTVLLGGAWLASRVLLRSNHAQDLVWKGALVGGLATATLQMAIGGPLLVTPLTVAAPAVAAPRPTPALVVATPEPAAAPVARRATPRGERARATIGTQPTHTDVSPARAAVVPTSPAADLSAPPAAPAHPADPSRWLLVLAAAWTAAAAFGLTRLAVVRIRLARKLAAREAVTAHPLVDLLETLRASAGLGPIRLSCAPALSSPVALGRREICVPPAALSQLLPAEQRGMLAHELAHIARRDPQWLAFAYAMEHVLFLQPLNALARRRLQGLAEFLCDDWAVARTGSGLVLARCLATVAEWVQRAHPVPLAGMAEQRSHLVARIERLVKEGTVPVAPTRPWKVVTVLGALGLVAVAVPGVTIARAAAADRDLSRDHAPSADEARMPETPDMSTTSSDAASTPVTAVTEMRVASNDEAALLRQLDDTTQWTVRAPRLRALARGTYALARGGVSGLSRLDFAPRTAGGYKDKDGDDRQPVDPRTVAALIAALKDADAEVRAAAARSLGELHDTTAVPALMAIAKDPNKEVRRAVINALSDLEDHRSLDIFLDAANDADPEVRERAANTLGDLKDPRAVPVLTTLLKDKVADVRQQAANSLGNFELTAAPQGLLDAINDPDADVRQAAINTVADMRDPRAVPSLKARLGDSNGDVREEAVRALSEIRDASALEAIIGAMKDPRPEVRRAAAQALGRRD